MSRCFDIPVPDVGTTVRVAQTFTTLGDPEVPIDPETVVLKVKDPNGVEFDQTVIRDNVGEYHGEVLVDISGQWWWRFETTDPVRADEGSFIVRASGYSGFVPDDGHMSWGELNQLSWSGMAELHWGSLHG